MLGEFRPLATECLQVPRICLLYHAVCPKPERYSYAIETGLFEKHAAAVAQARMDKGLGATAEFTFDDGYTSDFEYALPILGSYELRARFFITVGWVGNKPGHMGWEQVRRLHDAGHVIGGHGWSHVLLSRCSPAELDLELRGARETLEDKLGIPVTTMSFPGGRYNRRVLMACEKAGYTRVFTSEPRLETTNSKFTVGRVNISASRSPDWIRALLHARSKELRKLRRQYCLKRSAKVVLGDRVYERIWAVVVGKHRDAQLAALAAHENTSTNQ